MTVTQHLFFLSSPGLLPPPPSSIIITVLWEEPRRFHAASFTHIVQFCSSLSSFPLTRPPALLFLRSPWFMYILLKSSYTSGRQQGRQRQAAVNYLSFRADGCRRYVNVCVCVWVCLQGCAYTIVYLTAYVFSDLLSKKTIKMVWRSFAIKMMMRIVLLHQDVLMTEIIITGFVSGFLHVHLCSAACLLIKNKTTNCVFIQFKRALFVYVKKTKQTQEFGFNLSQQSNLNLGHMSQWRDSRFGLWHVLDREDRNVFYSAEHAKVTTPSIFIGTPCKNMKKS